MSGKERRGSRGEVGVLETGGGAGERERKGPEASHCVTETAAREWGGGGSKSCGSNNGVTHFLLRLILLLLCLIPLFVIFLLQVIQTTWFHSALL